MESPEMGACIERCRTQPSHNLYIPVFLAIFEANEMDRSTIEGIVEIASYIGILILAGVLFVSGCSMVWTTIYLGTVVEHKGTVQAVTRSDFLAPHTTVVLRTYSEDDVHFTLRGYHDFDIGAQYRIRLIMKPYMFRVVCWGYAPEGAITLIESGS